MCKLFSIGVLCQAAATTPALACQMTSMMSLCRCNVVSHSGIRCKSESCRSPALTITTATKPTRLDGGA